MAAYHEVVALPEGFRVWLEFNANNLRIQQIFWENPSAFSIGWTFAAKDGTFTDSGTIAPGASGSQNVAGNVRLVEQTDPDFGIYYTLPPGIEYHIWVIK